MAEYDIYGAMYRAIKNLLLFVMIGTFASGCYFDVSTDSGSGIRTAEELAGLMVVQFAQQIDGVTADIVCPTGLRGEAGVEHTCTGTTSDGYTLIIVVLEGEQGAFRWDVVESVPVTTAG